jgi:hypothetical protein
MRPRPSAAQSSKHLILLQGLPQSLRDSSGHRALYRQNTESLQDACKMYNV